MKPILKPISEQVIVLFGATSGIGLETAMQLVEKGAKVVIVGRSKEGLREAVDQVQMHAVASGMARGHANGGAQNPETVIEHSEAISTADEQILAEEADITNWDEVRAVAERINDHFGRIDTWVNIAGVSEWALFEETTPEEFRRVIDVNLIGQAHGAMAALPYLKRQGGALIFVASMAGRIPIPYQSAYNASKHGLLGLIDTLRQEVKHTDLPVSITAILPASINTPLFNKARTKLGVEPQPVLPIYDVRLAGRAIVYAAQNRVNELIVGDSGYVINFMKRVAPTATNNFMGTIGFRQQLSEEPKSALAPDNLEHHVRGYNETDGEFTPRTMQVSPLTWLATHPRVRLGILGLAITGLGFLVGSRIVRQRSLQHRTLSYRAGRVGKDISRFGNRAGTFLTALPLISSLPMFRRKSLPQRVLSALPEMPSFRRKKTLAQRLPLSRRNKSLSDRLPLHDQRKALVNALPNAGDLKDMVGRLPRVERRKMRIDKLPFGERYEAVVDRLPFRK